MRRYADKRDAIEKDIIKYLKRCGCCVQQLSQAGVPDLLVGFLGLNLLLEIKSSKFGTLTDDQILFFKKWTSGQAAVVRSIKETKEVLRKYMPIRVYSCKTCGTFEKKEPIKSDPLTDCPTCGKLLTQVYTAPAIIFKGNGWGGKKDGYRGSYKRVE